MGSLCCCCRENDTHEEYKMPLLNESVLTKMNYQIDESLNSYTDLNNLIEPRNIHWSLFSWSGITHSPNEYDRTIDIDTQKQIQKHRKRSKN